VRQQAFVALMEVLRDVEDPDNLDYVAGAVKKRMIDWLRVHGPLRRSAEGFVPREDAISLDAELPSGESYVELIEAPPEPGSVEDRLYLREAIANLTDREREVLAAIYVRGLRGAELAEEVGISEARNSQLHQEALHKLGRSTPREGRRKGRTRKARDETGLTDREKQVLACLAEGDDVKETAARLGLGIESIKTYRKKLLRALEAKNGCEAVAIGFRRGILGRPVG
jgi:RNA polymerase sigma factor (sigma-70 family)